MNLCFATNNQNKLTEVQQAVGSEFNLLSLKDIGCDIDIPETSPTIEGNSLQKAKFIFDKYQVNVFADDTGLEVEALDGEPGVKSARYAGEHRSNEDNIRLLLSKLNGLKNRSARFKTVVTLIVEGQIKQFTGLAEGKIISELKGEGGFGYDPVFVPNGYDTTFAEMPLSEKNSISHRGKAIEQLVNYLNSLNFGR